MNSKELLAELKALGSEQAAKTYRRHGAVGEVWGVSSADLGKLQKRIKRNHTLALELWRSGAHDARIFATLIADPAKATRAEVESWCKEVESYPLVGALATFVALTPLTAACAAAWMKSKNDWTSSAGWRLLGHQARQDADAPDDFFEPFLKTIQTGIQRAPNRTRYAMNNALISIGSRGGALEKKALEVATAIGKVQVDHGNTDCKTPNAAASIAKVREHLAKKKRQDTP